MKSIMARKKSGLLLLVPMIMVIAAGLVNAPAQNAVTDQVIFPGQADPRISADIMRAYEHALNREYDAAKELCVNLYRDFPNNPAGPTGEMVLYQVMMLENDDYELDAEFRAAARRAEATANRFAATAPKTDWYYTLLGATTGIKGIYFLRRGEYYNGLLPGVRGYNYMRTAHKMSPDNWEARLAMGVFLYYRSAYADVVPGTFDDQRKKGISEVEEAGKNRPYLYEVSRIALFYIYINEKDYDTAFRYMNGLIKERPDFPVFYQLAGRALMEKGDYENAYRYYMKMNQIDPDLYLPYCKLGECTINMGKQKEARRWYAEFFLLLGENESVHRKEAEKNLKKIK